MCLGRAAPSLFPILRKRLLSPPVPLNHPPPAAPLSHPLLLQVGECVIRPSHTGPMKLCLTVKMPEGVWHLDLLEQGKVGDAAACSAPACLGSVLP